ncbi:unnamed protein product [Pleuronectes platessa]|uniref:Uncharacterized protein n=1 Tax=Pleuronectes platessa TaxID=8262 RepID=A0A9N7Z3M3_PLEPL|nr:unnamed protein product [Pleuronectes platessa]
MPLVFLEVSVVPHLVTGCSQQVPAPPPASHLTALHICPLNPHLSSSVHISVYMQPLCRSPFRPVCQSCFALLSVLSVLLCAAPVCVLSVPVGLSVICHLGLERLSVPDLPSCLCLSDEPRCSGRPLDADRTSVFDFSTK